MQILPALRRTVMTTISPRRRSSPGRHPFSVLVLLPDYLADQPGDTVYCHIDAPDAATAERLARELAASQFPDCTPSPDDFLIVLIIAGHHAAILPESTR